MISRIYVTPKKMEKHGGSRVFGSYLVVHKLQKDDLLKVRPSEIETKLQLKQRPRKSFDPAFLKKICEAFEPDVFQNLLYEPHGVRQLQEIAFEEYARQVPEIERADSAGVVYEKVATWVATTFPMPAEK